MAKVFVYGTLKRGGVYQAEWMRDQLFLNTSETEKNFRLYSTGPFPVMVPDSDGYPVTGELWEVDDPGLRRLDRLEGISEGEYTRAKIKVKTETDPVWAYLYLRETSSLPECGPEWPISPPPSTSQHPIEPTEPPS